MYSCTHSITNTFKFESRLILYSCTHVPRPNASGRFELNKGFEDFVPMYSRTQTKCIRYIFSNIGFENFVPMYPVRNTILIMPQNLEAL